MNTSRLRITLALAVSLLGLTIAWLYVLSNGSADPALAGPPLQPNVSPSSSIRYVVVTGTDSGDCTNPAAPCHTIQYAVDVASNGDEIRVATGVYTDVQSRPAPAGYGGPSVITQVVYISKTLTLQGGYATTDWSTPYPLTQPTTLDALGQGRVLFISGSVSPTIEGLRLTGGNATGLGGYYNWMDFFTFDTGGGVYVITATATIRNTWVFSNATTHWGGGLYLRSSDAMLNGNAIFSNTTTYASTYEWLSGRGGGLFLHASHAMLVGNTIFSNTVMGSGGGVYLFGSDAGLSRSDAMLSRNVVTSNIANGNLPWFSGRGGGLFISFTSVVTLNGNIIADNAASEGGGAYLGGSDAMLSHNTIMSNTANDNGGGIYGSGTLTNNVIADNQASTSGSGMYINGPSRLFHTTIARNTGGDGSGVYVGSTVAMTNTILVSHTVGITATAGNTVTLNGILWYSNATNYGGLGVFSVTNAITDDPALAADGYHLTAGSAARGKGVNAGVTTDIDGEPRHDPPDLGADEYYPQTGLAVSKEAAPSLVQAGSQLTYTLHITNTTNVDLHATITDTLPTHITLGQTSGGTLILPGGTITWTPVITALGGTWTETIVVTVAMGYAGILTNTVQAATLEGASGIYTATSQVQVIPALAVTKDATPNPVQAGAQLTYTLRVTNTGNMDLHATITDTLPSYVAPTGVITWTATIPAPGGVWTRTVVVTVTPGYSGTLTNRVQVTTPEGATGESQVAVRAVGYQIYLPIVLRN